MTLREEDVRRIGEYVKPWIREMVERIAPHPVDTSIDQSLLERMVRVEEELKSQRELMEVRFTAMDQRFDDMLAYSDRRFATVDRRFETADRRFDDMQESFKRTQWLMGLGFVLVTAAVTVFGLLN